MIRYIFFDLGNVLLHFDHAIACREMAELLNVETAVMKSLVFDGGLQNQYEEGLVSCEEYCHTISTELNCEVDQDALLTAASDMFELNVPIVALVAQLATSEIPIGILSNTCKAHWDFVNKRFTLVKKYFEQRILSYEEKSMKPDGKIYQSAIKLAGVQPGEIFFMDDRADNVQGAIAMGLDAVQFTSVRKLVQDLRQRGIDFNY